MMISTQLSKNRTKPLLLLHKFYGSHSKDKKSSIQIIKINLAEELKGDSIIKIKPIFFNFDDSKITSIAKKQLKPVFDYLKKYTKIKFKIKAHTDSIGNEDYNLKLSERRAASIYTYLRYQEIKTNRILSRKRYGEEFIKNECNGTVTCSEQKHKKNRRIDFVIEEDTTE
ncbi:MAG: OmpA family protein [Polaribacter sp.]|uniref:OmpA family protein n=1 Tax=Polaribacter sp. TaxID=1920175 RepID=UPI0038510E00